MSQQNDLHHSRAVRENLSESTETQIAGNDGISDQDQRNAAQLGSTVEEPRKAVGMKDEVLSFAGNIAHHPETWLDYPIEEEDDLDEFEMSDSQKEHVMAIESLTPRLRALRIELCPAHMSVGYFWKVYFVLLHSRLNKRDAELLSTLQVVVARAKWMHELQKRTKEELERQRYYNKKTAFLNDDLGPSSPSFQQQDNSSLWTFASEPACSSTACDSNAKNYTATNADTDLLETNNTAVKAMVEKNLMHSFDDDDDDWAEDDYGKCVTAIPLGIEEEVSFSDLEDDDCSIHAKYNI